MAIRHETSAETAARFLALRSAPDDPRDPRRGDVEPRRTTLQQLLVAGEYRYHDVDADVVYTAAEARALPAPVLVRYIDGGVSFRTRYIDHAPQSARGVGR